MGNPAVVRGDKTKDKHKSTVMSEDTLVHRTTVITLSESNQINNCSSLYCLFEVNYIFMLVLEIRASKPPRIDLKSGQCYENDPFV